MAVNGISGINTLLPVNMNGLGSDTLASVDSDSSAVNFGSYLKDALGKVNNLQLESEQIGNDFAVGKTDNIHQVMIAAEKADIALQFTMQIRNKILDAYSEIMRMQI
ncbi:MAG: flagellar hook-basal body complex protein FliE [Clostridiales bacterium]|jgi:flagellar hook-basal body complex protein FliE|nr:flagellar hook-basal body complex protein FliE [Clostridiales bacterium]